MIIKMKKFKCPHCKKEREVSDDIVSASCDCDGVFMEEIKWRI